MPDTFFILHELFFFCFTIIVLPLPLLVLMRCCRCRWNMSEGNYAAFLHASTPYYSRTHRGKRELISLPMILHCAMCILNQINPPKRFLSLTYLLFPFDKANDNDERIERRWKRKMRKCQTAVSRIRNSYFPLHCLALSWRRILSLMQRLMWTSINFASPSRSVVVLSTRVFLFCRFCSKNIYDSIFLLGEMNLWKSVKGKVHMMARRCSTPAPAYMLHYYLCADHIMFGKLNSTQTLLIYAILQAHNSLIRICFIGAHFFFILLWSGFTIHIHCTCIQNTRIHKHMHLNFFWQKKRTWIWFIKQFCDGLGDSTCLRLWLQRTMSSQTICFIPLYRI